MSLHRLQEAAQNVLDNWEKGDLAFAVRYLAAALETSKSGAYRDEVVEMIEQGWLSRAKTQDYGKPSTAAYRKKEIEFFCGAMYAMQALQPGSNNAMSSMAPPRWVINPMTGRNVVEVGDGR